MRILYRSHYGEQLKLTILSLGISSTLTYPRASKVRGITPTFWKYLISVEGYYQETGTLLTMIHVHLADGVGA